jgi:hypothetical protein
MYRFAKKNLTIVNVAAKVDPPIDTPPAELMPEKAGDFTRTSLMDTLEGVPDWKDVQTSSAHVAVYEDPNGNKMTVIAVSTQEAQQQRQTGTGILTMGRGKANAPDVGVSIRDTFSGPGERVITTWAKPNWTFMVQTSSSLTQKFLEDFYPGGTAVTIGTVTQDGGATETVAVSAETTPTEPPAAPEPPSTPVPADAQSTTPGTLGGVLE